MLFKLSWFYKGSFSPKVITESRAHVTTHLRRRKLGAQVRVFTIQSFPEFLALSPLLPSTASPATSQYSWTLRGPREGRNKTLNNLFGVLIVSQRMFLFCQSSHFFSLLGSWNCTLLSTSAERWESLLATECWGDQLDSLYNVGLIHSKIKGVKHICKCLTIFFWETWEHVEFEESFNR